MRGAKTISTLGVFGLVRRCQNACPSGPKRELALEQFHKGLLPDFYSKMKGITGEQKFFIGESFTFADIIIGSVLHFSATVLSDEESNLKKVKTVEGGIWGLVIDELEKYRQEL